MFYKEISLNVDNERLELILMAATINGFVKKEVLQ